MNTQFALKIFEEIGVSEFGQLKFAVSLLSEQLSIARQHANEAWAMRNDEINRQQDSGEWNKETLEQYNVMVDAFDAVVSNCSHELDDAKARLLARLN